MKAARFYEKNKLIVEDVPLREPLDNEVVIKIHYCGICGTDVHIFEGDKGSAEAAPPVTLGHELSGEVAKTGTGVHRFKVGDKVSVDPNDSCDNCRFCANGNKHLCKNMVGIGTAADGGFAEYIIVKERQVFKVPEGISYKSAAMIEPLSCCLHGIELADVHIGDTVMIVGTGNIGLIMVQLAKHMGAAAIIAVEPWDTRRQKAKEYGADILIHPSRDDTDEILQRHGIENVDKVIDCAGRINTAQYAIKYAGRGAAVMLFGLTAPDDEVIIKPFEMFQKELTIKASFVNPYTFEKSIRLLESGIVRVEDMITDVVKLSDIQKVFEEKLYAKNGKILVKMCEEESGL